MDMGLQQIKTGTGITVITENIINRICRVQAFDNKEMNDLLYVWHQNLLRLAMNKNKSYEVGVFINLADTDDVYTIRGKANGIDMRTNGSVMALVRNNPPCSVAVLHNHPRNSLFSAKDISTFCDYDTIYLLTAVCNDGTIYLMRKEPSFDPVLLKYYYNEGVKLNMDKGERKYRFGGIKNVAKHAKRIGITYRCSIVRKRGHKL